MEVNQRRKLVADHNRCFNCLSYGHSALQCGSENSCRRCQVRHHTLLCVGKDNHRPTAATSSVTQTVASTEPTVDESDDCDSAIPVVCCSQATREAGNYASQMLLATALIDARSGRGSYLRGRALIDSASQTNFITSDFARKLGLTVRATRHEISSLSCHKTTIEGFVDVVIRSTRAAFSLKIKCAVIPTITTKLPQLPVDRVRLEIPAYCALADPDFDQPAALNMLLAVDVFVAILRSRSVFLGQGRPTLYESRLGWIVMGPAPSKCTRTTEPGTYLAVNFHLANAAAWSDAIERFWKTEEIDTSEPPKPLDTVAEDLFLGSLVKVEDRFQVGLLFRDPDQPATLGDSYPQARERFRLLEGQFRKDTKLASDYADVIEEYEAAGHAREIQYTYDPHNVQRSQDYFMPHHPVVKETSTTTRVRVVFDASMKSSSGVSLNDTQLKGAPTQAELFDILLRFRTFRYVFAADIKQMYRQIWITPEHRRYQRIVWRSNPYMPIRHLELCTVTFGITSAPYTATRVLKYLCDQLGSEFPGASRALQQHTYIDDVLCGHDDLESAKLIQRQLMTLLRPNGFHLRKWCANDMSMLEHLPVEDVENLTHDVGDSESCIRTLGLLWDLVGDIFGISVPEAPTRLPSLTKRALLSEVMSLFDPLGVVGAVTVKAKIFMQEAWASGLDWDEPQPEDLAKRWRAFASGLHALKEVRIPRWVLDRPTEAYDVIGFCDASSRAYGCCLYIRAENSSAMRLLCAKSRVAPIKSLTMPRLELKAAVLLARLFAKVHSGLPLRRAVHFYSDSQKITLKRLRLTFKHADALVAHRADKIRTLAPDVQWHHIALAENPCKGVNIISTLILNWLLQEKGE